MVGKLSRAYGRMPVGGESVLWSDGRQLSQETTALLRFLQTNQAAGLVDKSSRPTRRLGWWLVVKSSRPTRRLGGVSLVLETRDGELYVVATVDGGTTVSD